MTLVPNPLQQLNGNKLVPYFWIFFPLLFACSSLRTVSDKEFIVRSLQDTITHPGPETEAEDIAVLLEKMEKVDRAEGKEFTDIERIKEGDKASQWVFSILLPAKTEIIGEQTSKINSEQQRLLNFYIGCKMALDSLQSIGANLTVRSYDIENKKTNLQQIVKQGKLKDSDLIIGLTRSNHYDILLNSLSNGDRDSFETSPWILSPWNNNSQVAGNHNRFVFLRPDARVFSHQMYGYAKQHYAANRIFIVHSDTPSENLFISHFRALIEMDSSSMELSSPHIVDISQSFDELTKSLSQLDSALVIYPNFNKVNNAFKLLNHLSNKKELKNIAVMGMPSWKEYDWGNFGLWNQFHLILPVLGYTTNYNHRKEDFLRKFYALTGSLDYEEAMYGHDIVLFCYDVFNKYGVQAFDRLDWNGEDLTETGFELLKIYKSGIDPLEQKAYDYLQNWNIRFQQMRDYYFKIME